MNEHEDFIDKLIKNNKHYREEIFSVLSKYTRNKKYLICKTRYGYVKSKPINLLKGYYPTIQPAVFKDFYFEEILRNTNKNFYNRKIFRVSSYKDAKTKILFKTKYGLISQRPQALVKNVSFGLQSAVNKSEYFNLLCTDIHYGKYLYTKVNYTLPHTKVCITCPIHGDFEQTAHNHIMGQGCIKCIHENLSGFCLEKWNLGKNKTYFLYIIECFSATEVFFKIGRTYRTLKERYRGFPYKYNLIYLYGSSDAGLIFNYEKELKDHNREFRYKPLIDFRGKTECFLKIKNYDYR